jgi:hypothetical protein
MRAHRLIMPLLLIGGTLAMAMGGLTPNDEPLFTSDFGLERCADEAACSLVPSGGNAYFSLEPGRVLRFEGEEEGEFIVVEHINLDKTRPVWFNTGTRTAMALTRVIEERLWIDGELAEVTLNYYACCANSGDVFCFGEDVSVYENGVIVSHEGSWLAGQDSARPGLLMPGLFLLGARYYQELAPGVAMGRAEHLRMGLNVGTPAGVFHDCVEVVETDPLDEEDDEVLKIYARGVGPIVDGTLELVDYH